jgi:hypothetical protein
VKYLVYCYTNKIAAKDVGVKYPGICRAIKNNCKSGGFYWRKVV